ncbi:MAG: sodium-independent anion transporter [Saprospiraceae bacterium]|nr:MAG: sodium-independent anion transporter [Saprospiraceae bacterium]
MRQYLPIINWLKNYKKEWIGGDLSAGLTVGVMLIPQGMAYAMLAGLPPIYGLYASTIPLIIYAIFGTSRQLAVGPVAMVALLISSGVGQFADIGSSEFITLAILLALMVGVIQFSMGLFRLGFIVNFLSHPVIAGFTSAAALIIGFSQIKHLLGIEIPRGKVHETLINIVQNIENINLPTFLLGVAAIVTLLAVKRLNKRIPGPLIIVLLGIIGVYLFQLTSLGVNVVGEVPGGLPAFSFPMVNIELIQRLLPTALTISFIGFMESIAVAKAIQKKHKDYEIDNNQELIGLGLANIVGSFFKAFPVTGGFSRTAVNDQGGAKTGLAAIFSAILIIVTLLFLTDYFYNLPTAVLSAIIMVAVFGLIDVAEAKHLWQTDRRDFVLFMITAVGTLVLGIEEGIILGAVLSLIVVIYNISYPHVAVLGRSKDGKIYRNIQRFEDVQQLKEILIIRFDAQLYFANVNYFKDFVWAQVANTKNIQQIILDARPINNIDSSGIHALKDLILDLRQKNIQFYMVDIKGPVRDKLQKGQLIELIGKSHILNNIPEAVNLIENASHPLDKNRGYATQTNV